MKAKLHGELACVVIQLFIFIAQHSLLLITILGVKPKHKDFTPDDAIYFKKLVENSSFPAVIKNIKSDIFDQDLYEIVLFGKEGKIHEVLCQEDRALPI